MENHPASPAPISVKDINFQTSRRSATYHPSVWGEYFLTHASNFKEISACEAEELQKLREEVRKLLVTTADDSLHKLELIDAIQRLGVAYHFEDEIETSLKNIYDSNNFSACTDKQGNDLHMVALRFRLLRQQGYHLLSADVFSKFIDHEGKFKSSLIDNVQGILSLYEAAHLSIQGEETLDQALEFSSYHLKSMSQIHMTKSLAAQINEALKTPIRKAYVRLGARKFMPVYEDDESHNEILLKFAKLDFNFVQKIHQKELGDLTRWWKDLDFTNKMPFARDRVVEDMFWAVSDYFEPQYHFSRMIQAKSIAMITVIDDIYDHYGTMNDLKLLTNAVDRWDYSCLDNLPTYITHCYKALLDLYAEIENENAKVGISYPVHYARETMKNMIKEFYEEAKWYYNSYIPPLEEYLKVALVSGGPLMTVTATLSGLGNLVSKEEFDWVVSRPPVIRGGEAVGRLLDDMAGFGFEPKISAVDCYMKEHGGSKEESFAEFQKRLKKAWKDMNQDCLKPTAVSTTVLMRVLNFSRLINLTYGHGEDDYGNSSNVTKDYIKCMFVEPVPV